ncbi:MAG: pacearchaeosortase [Nanoarchaeota archaeon]
MFYYRKLALRLALSLILALFPSITYFFVGPLTLWVSFITLKLFYSPVLTENTIIIGSNTLRFIPACAAVSVYILLALLILLTKGIPTSKMIKMFILGGFLIFIANIIRIDLLIMILTEYGIDYFRTLHLFFWHIVSSVYVFLVWIFLIKKFEIKEIPVYSDFITLKRMLRR